MYDGIRSEKSNRLLIQALAAGVLLVVLYAARAVVTPLRAGFIAAFLIEPVVAAIARKTGRTAAAALTLALLAIGLAAVLMFLAPKAVREAKMAAESIELNITELNASIQRRLATLPEDVKTKVAEHLSAFSGKIIAVATQAVLKSFGILGNIADAVAKLLLFVVAFVFLMLDFPLIKPGLLKILSDIGWPPERTALMDRFLSESNDILRSFFRGQLLYAAAIGGLSAAGLVAIGLPYGLTIGLTIGLLSLVPYVGITLGLIAALGVSFYSQGTLLHLALTAAVFALVQAVDAVLLTPKLLGGSVGIHPLLAVIALLAFSQLFGFFGLMLAIPLAAILLAAFRRLLGHFAQA